MSVAAYQRPRWNIIVIVSLESSRRKHGFAATVKSRATARGCRRSTVAPEESVFETAKKHALNRPPNYLPFTLGRHYSVLAYVSVHQQMPLLTAENHPALLPAESFGSLSALPTSFLLSWPEKPLKNFSNSTGNGKTIVELRSPAISLSAPR